MTRGQRHLCNLGLQLVLELVLEKVDITFQVQARQVARYKGHQLLLAGQGWRLAGILQVLVQQPGAQDGWEGTEGRKAGGRVRPWPLLPTLPPMAPLQGALLLYLGLRFQRPAPSQTHSGVLPESGPVIKQEAQS